MSNIRFVANEIEFKKNDIVEIVDDGYLYARYKEGADYMGLKNWNGSFDGVATGRLAKITDHSYHPKNYDIVIYGVKLLDSDDEIIMSAGGLKLVSSYKILPDELFAI